MKALVMSGGGSRGAYTAGAIKYLTQNMGFKYDIYTGISVGALNAAYMSQFTNDADGAESLSNFWLNVKRKEIYKHWFPFSFLHALWKKSAYNSRPLWRLVEKSINDDAVKSSGKKVGVGTVCLNTGEYKVFRENDANFIEGVIASSAFPGAFCPIDIDGKSWVDGGVRHLTPIKTAIDMGATEIDIIITSRKNPKNINNKKSTTTIPLLLRSLDIMRDEISDGDLETLELYNQLVSTGVCTDKKFIKYNIIRPSKHLVDNILEFDHEEIKKNIDKGFDDAKKVFLK